MNAPTKSEERTAEIEHRPWSAASCLALRKLEDFLPNDVELKVTVVEDAPSGAFDVRCRLDGGAWTTADAVLMEVGEDEVCSKCESRPVEYVIQGGLCEPCWLDWWCEGFEHVDQEEVRREHHALLVQKATWPAEARDEIHDMHMWQMRYQFDFGRLKQTVEHVCFGPVTAEEGRELLKQALRDLEKTKAQRRERTETAEDEDAEQGDES